MDKASQEILNKIYLQIEHLNRTLDSFHKLANRLVHRSEAQGDDGESPTNAQGFGVKMGHPAPAPAKVTWRDYEWWKSRIELLAFLFAIMYSCVTYLQREDTRSNFQADERSWIKLTMGFPTTVADLQKVDQVQLHFKNIGKSPATHIVAQAVIEVVPSDNPPTFDIRRNRDAQSMEAPLFPGDEMEFDTQIRDRNASQPREFKPSEIADLESGGAYLAVFGIVTYKDSFGEHWYRFCNWKPYSGRVYNSKPCVDFNLAGDVKTEHTLRSWWRSITG